MKHNLLKSVIISVILLMGVSNAWGEQNLYEVWMQYTFNGNSNSYTYYKSDNNSSQSLDLGTLTSDFIITDCYWKCYADWKPTTTVGYLWYQLNTGNGVTKSKSVSNAGSGNYEVGGSSLGWKVASKTDPSGKYTMKHNFYAHFNYSGGHNDWTMNNSGNNYKYTYTVLPPSVKGFTITPSGNKLSGSGTQNDPYIIKHNGSLTLTLSGSQNHTDANSTIQYNTAGTWNTKNSRTISNITSTDVKNVTVKARYKNNSDANLCGTESSQTIYYRSEQVYTVTFNANGHGTAPAAQTVSQGSKATQPAAPTATGYTFSGWYREAGCTIAFDFNTAINANITLYAKWTAIRCNITLTRGDGASGGSEYVYATYGSNILEPEIENPTKTGYNFLGWSNQGGNVIVIDTNGKLLPSKSNGSLITYTDANGNWAHTGTSSGLWAQWEAAKYNINYKDQGNVNFSGTHTSGYPTQHTYGKATSLLTATKTGYTFEGWFKNPECTGSAVTTLASRAYTATITLYAKWTINQYTLNYSAGEGGTVSGSHSSGAKLNYNTSVTLTATASGENAFAQWVDENGSPLSSNNPYTFNIKDDITAKAVFSQPTTVYFKPSDNWKEANAHFAIYAWGKFESWVELEKIDCHGNYYKADVPAGFSDFAFVRLIPSSDPAYNSNNNGYNWENKWNQTENLIVPTDGKKMYDVADRTHIHLRPNSNWTQDNARFAAYFFNNSGGQWVSLTKNGNEYTCVKPTGYTSVIFGRMQPGSTNSFDADKCWNKTKDLTLLNDGTNCFTIKNDDWGCAGNGDSNNGADGEWSTVLNNSQWKVYDAPTYTVKLEKTTYGKYAIELNGQKYSSSQSEDVVINNVPVESTLRLVSSESFNAAYNNNMCIQTHDGVDFEELNAEHRICGNTIIKENFTTRADHTVYLRVSTSDNEINTNWNQGGHSNFIYSDNNIGGKVITTTSLPDGEIYKETGYNYYKFIIPAGCRTFRFERKTSQNAYYASNTENFLRYLPLGTSNCYTIEKKISDNSDGTKTFNGSWGMSLANGDYRLLYVEQVVTNGDGNESWKTVIKNTYQHSSDIIKKRTVTGTDIVSLHINYDETKHPRIILQQFSNGNWVDVEGEARMAVGPLTANPGRAMLPGRRNIESLTYDDGIEEIKQDKAVNGYAGRVWNFTVQQTVDNGNVTANLLFDPINAMEGRNLEPYSGNYYIRTDNAEGGWMDYTIPDNHMHFSQYALENSGFSHYFCKWVETKKNTKFVIANDYGAAISDTLSKDDYTDEHGNIADDANIRWSWNEYTNEAARAYIQGTWQTGTQNRNRNLVVNYKASSSVGAAEELLDDSGDWIYQKNFTVKVGSHLNSLTAQYPVNTGPIQTFAENLDMLTGDNSNDNAYVVRVLYDFKINKTLIALVPNEHGAEIAIDVMIERTNQDPATQVQAPITYTNNQRSGEGSTVYAVMSFTKDHLTDNTLSEQEKLTYWISFPFDVTISDVFGFGEVGQYWMIKYYDGAERADIGWFLDTKTFWKYKTKKSDVLNANTGYVLTLNKKVMDPNSPIFTNTEKVSLYFPSTAKITTIDPNVYTETEVEVPTHICTITSPADRTTEDSNWNLIGVPSYANKNCTTTTTSVKYFYDYDYHNDKYNVAQNGGTKTFQSMFAYMVQFGGTIDWKSFDFKEGAQGLAAKRNTDSDAEQHNLRLELQQNGTKADQTFVQLQDEDATQMFDMNSDLCKIINAGSNIYSIITAENTPVNVAGNVLPIQETVIPLGVVISAAGEYTFAMPDGTDGIVVELIDYETNTRTNMLLDEYSINLGKGTFENRFALHVKPNKTTTSIVDVNTNSNGVKKYLIDGILYMQKDGVLYDAQGKLVR